MRSMRICRGMQYSPALLIAAMLSKSTAIADDADVAVAGAPDAIPDIREVVHIRPGGSALEFSSQMGGASPFGGVGYYNQSLSEFLEQELIPRYGVGLRYMLLESQRLNLRVDYARSDGSDAVYLSVGEAFQAINGN